MPGNPPLIPDFAPGFIKQTQGFAEFDCDWTMPCFNSHGTLCQAQMAENPWRAATNASADYSSGPEQTQNGQVGNYQLKMALVSKMFQIFNDVACWGLDLQPGTIRTGGRDGTWLVVPLS